MYRTPMIGIEYPSTCLRSGLAARAVQVSRRAVVANGLVVRRPRSTCSASSGSTAERDRVRRSPGRSATYRRARRSRGTARWSSTAADGTISAWTVDGASLDGVR